MKFKSINLLGVVGVFFIVLLAAGVVISAPFEDGSKRDRLKDLNYKDNLRSIDVFRESNGRLLNRNYKNFTSSERRITIEDNSFNTLLDFELLTEYENFCSGDGRLPCAVWRVNSFDANFKGALDDVKIYDRMKDYKEVSVEYYYAYGIDSTRVECEPGQNERDEDVPICKNITRTTWTNISELSEMPSWGLKLGLFINGDLKDTGEFVQTIGGFELYEYAGFVMGVGTPFVYDNIQGDEGAIVKINDTLYIVTYESLNDTGSAVGFVILLSVNLSNGDITNASTRLQFSNVSIGFNSMVMLNNDNTLFFNINGANVLTRIDGQVFSVNLTTLTVTIESAATLDSSTIGRDTSLQSISGFDALATYTIIGNDGLASYFSINETTFEVTMEDFLEFDPTRGRDNSLGKLNDSRFLNCYSGQNLDGFCVTLDINNITKTISMPAVSAEHDPQDNGHNSVVCTSTITCVLAFERLGSGRITVFTVTVGGFVNELSNFDFGVADTSGHMSFVEVNSTRFALTYGDANALGTFSIFDKDGITMSLADSIQFDPLEARDNAMVYVNETGSTDAELKFINIYEGQDTGENEGFAIMLDYTFSNCLIEGILDPEVLGDCEYSSPNFNITGNLSLRIGGIMTCTSGSCNLNFTTSPAFLRFENMSTDEDKMGGNWTINALG